MVDQFAIADNIFQITDQTQFEEHHRVDTLVPTFALISLGRRIEAPEVEDSFQAPIVIVLQYPFAQLEMGEQFLLVVLFSLHT